MVADPPPSSGSALFDGHCHAWRRWPYRPAVPDDTERGTIDQLLYEMDSNGVAEALVVCAAIDANKDNIDYVASARELHPGRLHVVADLDCTWSTTYHTRGSADRLRVLDDRYELVGFTHYLEQRNDGWLLSEEADALFKAACERRLIVSLAAGPSWQADLRVIARKHPDVPVLCHHLGDVRAGDTAGLDEVVASSSVPNIYVKASGFHYASARGWDHPWPDALFMLRRIFDSYGPGRLCWGSDFPASKRFCTFRQSLEAVRTHCRFLSAEDLRLVLGGTLRAVLAATAAG
ncbi:MAG: amidohydrolase family protein [Acidimicrobiales bacterium]